MAGSRSDQERLDEANRRWRGAACRTRVMLEVKKGSTSDGWVKCEWLWWGEPHSNERVRVLISNADAVHRRFSGRIIPAGTEMVVTGWEEESPGGTLYLVLELPGLPATVRVTFWDDWVGRVSASRIDDFERWARFDFLELVSVPTEQLEAVAEPTRPAPPAPALAAPRAGAELHLQVLAVAVEPATARPGDEIGLVVSYQLTGLQPDETAEVLEVRRLLRADKQVAVFEERVSRGTGTHTSTLPVRLPPDAAEGLYSVTASLSCGGVSAQGSALLNVAP